MALPPAVLRMETIDRVRTPARGKQGACAARCTRVLAGQGPWRRGSVRPQL